MARFLIIVIGLVAFAEVLAGRAAEVTRLTPPAQPVPATLFGMHIHHAQDTTPWPSVPIPEWRLWDARVAWPNLEPRRGQWNFAILDRELALAAQHNTSVLLPLGLSPTWASMRAAEKSVYQPGNAAAPISNQDWQNYVTTVVTHCKGRVQAYEIWNEPNNKGFWSGTTAEMVNLTREASQIIHKIDPAAKVVSPSATTTAGVPWLAGFLAAGGGQYVDIIGFHFYVAPQPPEGMLPLIQQVKNTMNDAGIGDKPVWNTETGWQAPKPFPPDLAAAYLARAFILSWAAGVQSFDWYAWDNHGWVTLFVAMPDNSAPSPAGVAFGVMQRWLVGAVVKGCQRDANRTWTCETDRGRNRGWILWNESGNTAFSIPPEWHVNNWMPLLGDRTPLGLSRIQIGQTPVLVYE